FRYQPHCNVERSPEYQPSAFDGQSTDSRTRIDHCYRQGERSVQVLRAAVAQTAVLSAWQTLHALGIFRASASEGETNRNVWARTLTSPMVCAISGIWEALHFLPALPDLW